MSRLPTPGGPWKRYACASPSSSAARSRRLASGCSETFSNASKDLLGDVCGRTASVDRFYPLWERFRQQTISVGDLPAELLVLSLDPVAVPADATGRLVGVDLEQEGAVGQPLADRRQVQLQDALDTEPARDTLISQRGVEVAVADDDRPALERRADHLLDELRARRREQRRLGPRRDPVRGQEQLAHPLAELCPARLPRRHHVPAGGPNRLGEQLGLSRLPRAV